MKGGRWKFALKNLLDFSGNRLGTIQGSAREGEAAARHVPSTLRFSDCKCWCRSVTLSSSLSQWLTRRIPLKNDPESGDRWDLKATKTLGGSTPPTRNLFWLFTAHTPRNTCTATAIQGDFFNKKAISTMYAGIFSLY